MAKQNFLQDVKNRMKDMQDSKAAHLETIRQKQEEARTQIEAARLAMKAATEEMSVEEYAKAKEAKRKAQMALDMYNERYNQIKQQEYISETESDSVIDSLLEYEVQLEVDFKKGAESPLRALAKLYEDYKAAVKDAEITLEAWQRDIHANYSTRGTMRRLDAETGAWTDRSEAPVPVHRQRYEGCTDALLMGEYLKKAAPLLEG